MGIRSILEALRDGIRDDAELKQYCQGKYSKNQTVFLGFNPADLPDSSYFPVVVIAGVDSLEITASRRKWRIRLGINIENDTIDTSIANSVTYEGFVDAEELREKVEEAIFRLREKLGRVEIEGNTIEDSLFDLFASETSIIVEQYRSQRKGE